MVVRKLFLLILLLAVLCAAITGIRASEPAITLPFSSDSVASSASTSLLTLTPARPSMITATVSAPAALLHADDDRPWQLYTFREGSFQPLNSSRPIPDLSATPQIFDRSMIPSDWRVSASALADVTGDGNVEWVLVVWRPWRDWPIQRWSGVRSPIADFHDEAGDSCHLILLDPDDGHEVWAGSALPAPALALAVGGVDGDKRLEVVLLEGDYVAGRQGPAAHVDVWRWNGFGFTLEWRSPSGTYQQLQLVDADANRILDIAVR